MTDTLISMKLSPDQAKEITQPDPAKAPKYPWGLELCIEQEQLEKLGLTELPKVGTKLQLVARVEVSATRESESQSGGAQRSLSLQVTDLALSADASDQPKAEQLYAGTKAT